MNLVVVANRVAGSNALEPRTGGLEAALVPVVVQQSGAIWVGPRRPLEAELPVVALGRGKLVRVDLPAEDYRRYYEGFSNSELWPALHSLTEQVSSAAGDYNSYRKINALMADALLEYRDRHAFWVHDYHFLTSALRCVIGASTDLSVSSCTRHGRRPTCSWDRIVANLLNRCLRMIW